MSATATSLPSSGPHQKRELHVPHAHSRRVGEHREEEEERRAERAEQPCDAGLAQGLRDEHEHRRGQDDPVGDDPVLEIDGRDRDEDAAEEGGDGGASRVKPNASTHADDEQRRDELDGRVDEPDRRSSQCRQRPRSARYETSGMLSYQAIGCRARHAGGAGTHERPAQRHASGDDVQKAPDSEAGSEAQVRAKAGFIRPSALLSTGIKRREG